MLLPLGALLRLPPYLRTTSLSSAYTSVFSASLFYLKIFSIFQCFVDGWEGSPVSALLYLRMQWQISGIWTTGAVLKRRKIFNLFIRSCVIFDLIAKRKINL